MEIRNGSVIRDLNETEKSDPHLSDPSAGWDPTTLFISNYSHDQNIDTMYFVQDVVDSIVSVAVNIVPFLVVV